MGSTLIDDLKVRREGDGDDRRYILEVNDYDFPEFDITPLLVSRETVEETTE